jgi:flagellar basal-body rod protein FlgG
MHAQQFFIDTIANDLANINTTGYKKKEVNFQDLLYQTIRAPGIQGGDVNLPVGVQVGHGVMVAGTTPVMTHGGIQETGNQFDMSIMETDGLPVHSFFRVSLPNDRVDAYTRDGNFRTDDQGRLVTVDGYYLNPSPGNIDPNATAVQITPEGRVMQKLPGQDYAEIGRLQLFSFINPAGLEPMGNNLWVETQSSGAAQQGNPAENGFGYIRAGFIEQSNVDAISEMVNMIAAQRAYEFNSRSIQTSDEMLQTVNSLKR